MNSECHSFYISHEYFLWQDLFEGTFIFYPVTLTYEFDLFFENFKLAIYYLTVIARALMFHMSIPCDRNFWWVLLFFFPVTLTFEFDLFFDNFKLAYDFCTDSARSLIFHMSDHSDKTFFVGTIIFYPVTLTLEFDLEHILWWDLPTGIRIFVLVTFAIFSGFILTMQFVENQHNLT